EGFRKHKLQTETLQAQRNQETSLVNAEKKFVEFRQTLAGEHDWIVALEQKARKAFGRFGKFAGLLTRPEEPRESDHARDEYSLVAELREFLTKAEREIAEFGSITLPKIFAQRSTPLAESIARGIARARQLDDLCAAKSDSRRARENERIENELKERKQWIEQEWGRTLTEAAEFRANLPKQIEAKHAHALSRNENLHARKLQRLESEQASSLALLRGESDGQAKALEQAVAEKEERLASEFQSKMDLLQTEWRGKIEPLYGNIDDLQQTAKKFFPEETAWWSEWKAPERFEHFARFGKLEVDLQQLAVALPKDERLALPGPAQFFLPLLLEYPDEGSFLIETRESGRDEALAALNNVILRLLSVCAPGRLSFTVIDPVGLGQNFSGTMHLADYAEHLINSHIWTQPGQIEEKLSELTQHMEKVIQMYLRNEYETIAEYNQQAGNIAEKYHFLVVADFPSNFSDTAARRLLNIANSGERCGVYTLIHWNQNQPQPADFLPDELRKSSVNLVCKGNRFTLAGKNFPGTHLRLDAPPAAEIVTEFIHKVGQSNRDSNRVEVPFAHVAPPEAQIWSEETTSELRVPIGRTGATKLQYLAIGKGTKQHALLAGKTGSGKSTLFHVIITNLALWASPEQVEFYLIDFKKGVEFKCYAEKKLPHARVVAIESDREFGLSVLQRVDDELKRRGDMFRKLGVQDLAGYKRAGGTEPMPRSLLMIDEFQEYFTEDDKVSQGASVLLDRIVRQGRAFGIHVILGSQTLGGAYTMARTTIGQMVIRIALQCNEADAYLIMDDNNPAPRLLSRPGEGIYNDAAGNILGNSPFQAVWLSDQVRDSYLDKVLERAEKSGKKYSGPIVFEGDAPADVRENAELQELVVATGAPPDSKISDSDASRRPQTPSAARIWLGAPNSIKGPTEAVFQKQSGN
ncbi:MAG: FtsK/SpoIIIE domain-containing protein, partial [Verrucomicrobiota bacterium]